MARESGHAPLQVMVRRQGTPSGPPASGPRDPETGRLAPFSAATLDIVLEIVAYSLRVASNQPRTTWRPPAMSTDSVYLGDDPLAGEAADFVLEPEQVAMGSQAV